MKVTYNWLKDFVQIKLSAQALADKLTMAGLEVTSLKEEAGDFIFEIEITSNRPDWLSVIGIAREVAVITGSKLKSPKQPSLRLAKEKGARQLNIKIEDKKGCPLYTAKIIKGVKVGPSPAWLQKRLELIGLRSVNNIVDITNYVLFEYGEPMHAFDLDKIKGKDIIIRRAKGAEPLTTIDATAIKLNKETLVIADQEAALAVAGVMGGLASEVTSSTRNILLEAALFEPVLIRKGRQGLGLQSESSYRFERGVSARIVEPASRAAAGMITELCGGVFTFAGSCGSVNQKKKTIAFDIKLSQRLTGARIPKQKIKNILRGLGFALRESGKDKLLCQVPHFRQDISGEIDLVEELSRIYGYARLPNTLPALTPGFRPNNLRELVSLTKEALAGLGLNEVITHSLVSRQSLSDCGINTAGSVRIKNPLNKEQEVLRNSLLPSLARCIAYNLNQKQDYVNIFEVASVYQDSGFKAPSEELRLGIALCGEKPLLLGKGLVKEELTPLHLKGIIESLFRKLGIEDYSFRPEAGGLTALYIGEEKTGSIVTLRREVLARLDIKNRGAFCLELSLEKALRCARLKKRFQPLPKYPGITRDISLVIKEEVSVRDILEAVRYKGAPLLEALRISDYYKGKQIPSGYRSLTLSCLYRSRGRTLTETEITPLHEAVCAELKTGFGATLR